MNSANLTNFFVNQLKKSAATFFWLWLSTNISHAQNLSQNLNNTARQYKLDPNTLSFFAQAVDADQAVVSINARTPQNPASLMKLVTTYAGLEILGPAYTWKTRLTSNAPLKNQVLQGPFYFKGGGDPNFKLENLWLMLRALRQQGIKKLNGPLVVDRSFFSSPVLIPEITPFDENYWRAYHVNADAALVNLKASALQFWPDAHSVRVTLDPPDSNIHIHTDVELSSGLCPSVWHSGLQFTFTKADVIQIKGRYVDDCGPRTWYFNRLDADTYLKNLWLNIWQSLGGTASKNFDLMSGVTPHNSRVLYEAVSPALSEVIRSINKLSNNVMAQQLFFTLHAQAHSIDKNAPDSADILKRWLNQKGLNTDEVVIENGSGLSRQQRLSAELLGRLLLDAYRSPVMPEFVASLPIVGLDGTMKSRLNGMPIQGHAHIKTGSLEGVKAIAGYVFAASGKKYVVVSIMNGDDTQAAQKMHDFFLQQIYQLTY